jgi:hypothetical protein
MKRIMVIALALLVMLAAVPTVKLMRFEVINKSEATAFVSLQEVSFDSQPVKYYLTIPAGVSLPGVRLYTLVRGVYAAAITACGQEQPSQFINLDLTGANKRLVILPCAMKEAQSGDGVLKFNPWLYPYEDLYGVPLIYDLGGVFKWRY